MNVASEPAEWWRFPISFLETQPCHLTFSGACRVAGGIFFQFNTWLQQQVRVLFLCRRMGRDVHLFLHIWTHFLKYLLYANTMAFAKGSFMIPRVEIVTWKFSIIFPVSLHLTSNWATMMIRTSFDHSWCSRHQAKISSLTALLSWQNKNKKL